MSTIIGNVLSTVLVLLYINVGFVNGQDYLPALMNQIRQEYKANVEPCRIIRNAYNNYEDEMKNFRKIQSQCKSIPRIVGFNEACEFLMNSMSGSDSRVINTFIRRVYYAMRNAVGDTPFNQLTPMHVVDGLVAEAESTDHRKANPATALCQHWVTTVDLCKGDNEYCKFGTYELGATGYCEEDMQKVYAACRALGLRSTFRLKSSQATSSRLAE